MGSLLSSGFRAAIFFLACFLDRFLCLTWDSFLRPDPQYCKAGARRAVKVGRRPDLAAFSVLARPYLDSSEHDGPLGAVGITIRGEPAFGRGSSRHNLVFGGSKDPTMMQSCASAAELRGGGPILWYGLEARSISGCRHLGLLLATRPPRSDGPNLRCLYRHLLIASVAGRRLLVPRQFSQTARVR